MSVFAQSVFARVAFALVATRAAGAYADPCAQSALAFTSRLLFRALAAWKALYVIAVLAQSLRLNSLLNQSWCSNLLMNQSLCSSLFSSLCRIPAAQRAQKMLVATCVVKGIV